MLCVPLTDLTRQPAPNVLDIMAAAGLAGPRGADLTRATQATSSSGDAASAAAAAAAASAGGLGVDTAAVAAAMAAVAAMNTQASNTIQSFGQAFQSYHEQGDAAAVAAAREAGTTQRVLVQVGSGLLWVSLATDHLPDSLRVYASKQG